MSTPSRALDRLVQRLDEVHTLVGLCTPEDADLTARLAARQRDAALCRAALVLLCGHMEGFFEEFVEDIVGFHEHHQTPIKDVAVRLRMAQLSRLLRTATGNHEQAAWDAVQELRQATVADEAASCAPGTLDAELIIDGFAVPGSDEVEGLLASVGIDRVWEGLPSDKLHLKKSLDALVHRRHPIAHGDASATATRGDLSDYSANMLELAKVLDERVARVLEAQHGATDPWAKLPR